MAIGRFEAGKAFMGRKAGLGLYASCLVVAGVVAGGNGCTAPRPKPDISDADPSVSIPGIKIAADRKNDAAAPELVKALESDDPAIRFFAIGALIRFTGGDRLGYQYYFDEDERKPSVAKWQEWLKRRQSPDQQQQEQPQRPENAAAQPEK